MRRFKRIVFFFCLTAAAGLLSGWGSSEEPDEASTRVMILTITPRPTPTPLPKEAFPKATATNENLTMINQYLVDQGNAR